MKQRLLAATAVAGLTLAACGGVDRSGTRDQFVEDVEAEGGTADGDCVDSVLDDYSDDEIEALADGETTDRSVQLATELFACTDLGG